MEFQPGTFPVPKYNDVKHLSTSADVWLGLCLSLSVHGFANPDPSSEHHRGLARLIDSHGVLGGC